MRRHPFRALVLLAPLPLALACAGDAGPVGPPPPPGALGFATLGAGYAHTCGLSRGGSAWCWGGNAAGSLGDGTRTRRTRPAAVQGGHVFVALDVGAAHACALGPSGAAWCWGHNDEGQLGDGSHVARERPVASGGSLAFASISAGHAHSCGITVQGVAYCWGDDTQGQLGDGGPGGATRSTVPVRVLTGETFTRIVAGYYQTCALTGAGAAWCWGLGSSGQNGDGTGESRHEPAAVAGGHAFSEVAAGDRFVCAREGSATWCWGALPGTTVPVAMAAFPALHDLDAARGASTIPGAAAYACGLRGERAWCWGGAVPPLRAAGEALLEPAIAALSVAAGARHACVLSRAGHAYCGGANYEGQLGDDTTTDRAALVPVAAPGP